MFINNLKFCTRLSSISLTKHSSSTLTRNIYKIKTINPDVPKRNYINCYIPREKCVLLIRANSNLLQNHTKSKCKLLIRQIGTNAKTKSSTTNGAIPKRKPPSTTKGNSSNRIKLKDIFMLFSLAKNEKLVIAGAIACLIVSSTITMCVPYALGRVLDIIFNKTDSQSTNNNNNNNNNNNSMKENLKNICLALCGVFLIGGLANFGRVYLFSSVSLRIVNDLRSKLYRKMVNQECGWFDTKGTGELINRLSSDTYIVGNSLSQNISDGLRNTVMIMAGTGMMIYTSPQLALVSAAVVPCIAGMAIVYGRYVQSVTKDLLDKYAEIMKSGEERLGNIHTVKMFCKEEQESQGFREQLIDALQLAYKEILAKASFFGLTGLSGNVIIVSVLYYGGTLVAQDTLSIGALTSFILYAAYSAISLNGLSTFYSEINKGVGAAQRVWEILERKHEIPLDEGIVPMKDPLGEISFVNVTFSFPSRPISAVLKNLNFVLNPGTTTAVVGRSGSGKTTIVKLVLRFYDPQFGNVKLDGVDVATLNPTWLRSYIGAVNQEPVLFSGTIRENILYGLNPGASISEDDFQHIIKEAHVDEFANRLPDGLDTLVGQRGMMLSGGQKQRVAIARALIKNPKILILDEATSALDTVSEELIQKALDNLIKGRTVLVIAHRLSTIRNADNIIVLDDGTLTEEGSYESLITRDSGIFRDLVRKQAFEIPVQQQPLRQ